ncbi:MAG: glycosyltransferase [Tannerellaceae bacterium]|jgi:glycosyltransferase involved in cell wall biosynthesis|nr:glycosyltransferase [Tannerellaceae bacterium]
MTFSIITVTFNAEKVLESTILSVLSQTYPHIEYISIDGNSTDGTKLILEQYADAFAYRISEKDKGLYDAMNKGLQQATGNYVWFLNAGDIISHSNVVTEMAEVARLNNLPDILYGETDWMNADGKVFAPRRLKAPRRLTWKSFRNGMLVSHQAFVPKRTITPGFDPQYRFSGDFDWCIRCMKAARTIINTRLRLVNYLYEGLTTANRKASLRERYRIMCRHYGTLPTIIRHIWFAIRFSWAKLRSTKY